MFQKCDHNEPGELISQIRSLPGREFKGYFNDEKATSKKILYNVVSKGDVWFRTGDLLKKNERGWWYFVDRIGDTFRMYIIP